MVGRATLLMAVSLLPLLVSNARQNLAYADAKEPLTVEALERQAIAIVERLFPDDLGLQNLIARYREQEERGLRTISYDALSVYLELTLRPKLSADKQQQLKEFDALEARRSAAKAAEQL